MIQLVLSLDYEIFGNGAGDVMRDVVRPTERLLDICDRHGAKLTIMFEVGEYWAFERYDDQLRRDLGYSPCGVMKAQIVEAIQRGHDVQLHLHPWWIGAALSGGIWSLRPQCRLINHIPTELSPGDDLPSAASVLYEGKSTLQKMVRHVCSDYECLVYRAAMFWGQPSRELIAGLRKAGLAADSSVVPGLYERFPVPTDYRSVPSQSGYWWTSADDIGQQGAEGQEIVEFPVYARLRPYVCNLKLTKLLATLRRRSAEKTDMHGHGMTEARRSTDSAGQILRKLGTRQALKYDFCKLSAQDMIRGLYRATKDDRTEEDAIGMPVVMLGHSKDFWNDRHLDEFLCFVTSQRQAQVSFATLGELTKAIVRRDVCDRTTLPAHNGGRQG